MGTRRREFRLGQERVETVEACALFRQSNIVMRRCIGPAVDPFGVGLAIAREENLHQPVGHRESLAPTDFGRGLAGCGWRVFLLAHGPAQDRIDQAADALMRNSLGSLDRGRDGSVWRDPVTVNHLE